MFFSFKKIRVTVRIAKALKKGLEPDGINLVQSNEPVAGQEVFHFHLHIKPRWKDDNVVVDWDFTRIDDKVRQETVNKIKKQLAGNNFRNIKQLS